MISNTDNVIARHLFRGQRRNHEHLESVFRAIKTLNGHLRESILEQACRECPLRHPPILTIRAAAPEYRRKDINALKRFHRLVHKRLERRARLIRDAFPNDANSEVKHVDLLVFAQSAIDLAKQPLFEFIIGIQEQNVVTGAFFYCGPMPKVQAFVLAFANNRDSLIVFGVLFENRRRTIAARIVNDNELVVGERLIQHAINTRTQIALAVENRYANRKAGHRPLLPE